MKCGINEISSKIQFLQKNIDRNPHKMHTCLEIGLELKMNYILFQEPYIDMNTKTTISHSTYYCIILKNENENIKSRVMIFAKKNSRFQFC